jgi:hypothetical protein
MKGYTSEKQIKIMFEELKLKLIEPWRFYHNFGHIAHLLEIYEEI